MKETSLNVFEDFKCIADKCKHNCCLQWEIDIDKKSLKRYKKIKGNFKKRIDDGVNFQTATFNLKDGRCAFLNSDNLCDLIINFGEKSLCEICKKHPRYINCFAGRIERGVGLCCEVIAKKVVEFDKDIREITVKKGITLKVKSNFEKRVLEYRDDLFAILKSNVTTSEKISLILKKADLYEDKFYTYDWKKFFLSLEILENGWKKKVEKINENIGAFDIVDKFGKSFENLMYIFIHRHLLNAVDILDVKSRTVFAVLSILFIANFFRCNSYDLDSNFLIDSVRSYSQEIEYSTENFYAILDKIDDMIKR